MRGTVINIHEHGATVRLEDGSLAAVSALEYAANRVTYLAGRDARTLLDLCVVRLGRHATAALARTTAVDADALLGEGLSDEQLEQLPTRTNIAFEMRLGAYLRETEAWAPSDRPAPAERHFIRKKRRADVFEARTETT